MLHLQVQKVKEEVLLDRTQNDLAASVQTLVIPDLLEMLSLKEYDL
jgi:hypothetical protein